MYVCLSVWFHHKSQSCFQHGGEESGVLQCMVHLGFLKVQGNLECNGKRGRSQFTLAKFAYLL